MNCWLTLLGYEEATAACILDMLLNAHILNQAHGILATGKLILMVEVLFAAMDTVLAAQQLDTVAARVPPSTDADDEYFQALRKEPRNILGKIMSYLAILRKLLHISLLGTLLTELLLVITGCAHYLKLLIRIGLHNALKVNAVAGTTAAIDDFLAAMRDYELLGADAVRDVNQPMDDLRIAAVAQRLAIPANSLDACGGCLKLIEKLCVRHRGANRRWHPQCFKCLSCARVLVGPTELEGAGFDTALALVLCRHCVEEHTGGFDVVLDLAQLVYLLKIALARLRAAMKVNFGNIAAEQQRVLRQMLTLRPRADEAVEGYTKTLDDVTRLRARRQLHKLSLLIKQQARRLVIVDAPEADRATETDLPEAGRARAPLGALLLSYNELTPEDDQFALKTDRLRIKDEDPAHQVHLDRTTDMLKNEKLLTLDDIPRIVAAEQARDQRPNAFKHHNSLYARQKPLKPVRARLKDTPLAHLNELLAGPVGGGFGDLPEATQVHMVKQQVDEVVAVPKRAKYYLELSKDEHFVMRHVAVEAFAQQFGHPRDELLPLIHTRKPPTFWDKLGFGGRERLVKDGVFGVELNDLTKRYGTDLDLGVGPCKLRIPIFVDDIILALKQKDMLVEGIFRLNGNIKKLRELTDEINKHPVRLPDFSHQNAVQLAALMKKWLREMPTPLLTFNLYDMWLVAQLQPSPALRKRGLQLCYCMLPRSHRNLVEVLLYFFSWVALFAEIDEETGSKMDIHNLATVIAPNVLFSKPASANGGDEGIHVRGEGFFHAIEVVSQMIEQHEEFSIIPDDLLQFYDRCGFDQAKPELLSTKDIVARVDKQTKEDGRFFEKQLAQMAEPHELPYQEVRLNTVTRGHTQPRVEHHGETTNI